METGKSISSRFEICVAFVLAHETEYDKHGSVKTERDPADPGGATKYGIDQRSHPNVNVPALTKQAAITIYHDDEWTKCRCALLKPWFDCAVFDTAVNMGSSRAIRLLQQAVGTKVDGFIGPITIAKTNGAALDVLFDYLDLRESYYRGLHPRLVDRYLKGWLNRVADLRKAIDPTSAKEMIA